MIQPIQTHKLLTWGEKLTILIAAIIPALLFVLALLFILLPAHAADYSDDPVRQDFFKSLQIQPDAQRRLGIGYSSCCGVGDTVHARFRVNKIDNEDQWQFLDGQKWRVIPADIIDPDNFSDYGPLLFRAVDGSGRLVCFIRPKPGL